MQHYGIETRMQRNWLIQLGETSIAHHVYHHMWFINEFSNCCQGKRCWLHITSMRRVPRSCCRNASTSSVHRRRGRPRRRGPAGRQRKTCAGHSCESLVASRATRRHVERSITTSQSDTGKTCIATRTFRLHRRPASSQLSPGSLLKPTIRRSIFARVDAIVDLCRAVVAVVERP